MVKKNIVHIKGGGAHRALEWGVWRTISLLIVNTHVFYLFGHLLTRGYKWGFIGDD